MREGGREVEGRWEIRAGGGSPIPGSVTCRQGIILLGVLLQELRSQTGPGREIASVQELDRERSCRVTRDGGGGLMSSAWPADLMTQMVVIIGEIILGHHTIYDLICAP